MYVLFSAQLLIIISFQAYMVVRPLCVVIVEKFYSRKEKKEWVVHITGAFWRLLKITIRYNRTKDRRFHDSLTNIIIAANHVHVTHVTR